MTTVYDVVRRYARQVEQGARAIDGQRPMFPLSFAPGEAYQFDWSHEVVLLSGTTVMVKVAHVPALPQSHAVRAGPIRERRADEGVKFGRRLTSYFEGR